jgi:hypothetical protein
MITYKISLIKKNLILFFRKDKDKNKNAKVYSEMQNDIENDLNYCTDENYYKEFINLRVVQHSIEYNDIALVYPQEHYNVSPIEHYNVSPIEYDTSDDDEEKVKFIIK